MCSTKDPRRTCKNEEESAALIALLKSCANNRDLHKGTLLHANILERGLLGKNIFLSNSLVNMYAKCGALAKAKEILEGLDDRNVATWNTLIAGYAQYGYGKMALECFEDMQCDNVSPDVITFTCILKACASEGALDKAKQIHAEAVRQGLMGDPVLGGALVDMYAKCGAFKQANKILESLPFRNVESWTALIAGYTQYGHFERALDCFELMQLEGISANAVTFACILNACGNVGALDKGKQTHEEVERQELLIENIVLCGALVDMYAKCGAFAQAEDVLKAFPVRNTVMWTALIVGYTQHGHTKKALRCFEDMQQERLSPNAATYASILKACGSERAIDNGKLIHDEIARQGLLQGNIVLASALVYMYSQCGAFIQAKKVLKELPVQNVEAWTALIAGYIHHGLNEKALGCFEQMQLEGLSLDAFAWTCVLKACGNIRALDKGSQIHVQVARENLLQRNPILSNALVDMYLKCGANVQSKEVLDHISFMHFNAKLQKVSHEVTTEPLCRSSAGLFEKQTRPEQNNQESLSYIALLKACVKYKDIHQGIVVHANILETGLLDKDSFLSSSVVNMYAKCGALAKAKEVFEGLSERDVGTWNALIAGYAQHGHGKHALKSFELMQCEGPFPNVVTFTCALKSCGIEGAIDMGKQIHTDIVRQELLGDIILGGALVDMYAKCGAFTQAEEVLQGLIGNVETWNALITGYSQYGYSEEVLDCFEQILHEGLSPNEVTLLCVLNACSHSGLLREAETYFRKMDTDYGIIADSRHYICMVDLFGRAGHFDKAIKLIEAMTSSPDFLALWHAFLGACRNWRNTVLGRWAFEHAVKLDMKDAATYVCMSNIYVAAGMDG